MALDVQSSWVISLISLIIIEQKMCASVAISINRYIENYVFVIRGDPKRLPGTTRISKECYQQSVAIWFAVNPNLGVGDQSQC